MIATRHSLVARLKKQPCDSDWEKFYRLYEKPILAVAAARGLNETDCQDVLQETMIRMSRHGFARYDATRRFTPFLFEIAKDCVVDALRRRARRRFHEVAMGASKTTSYIQPWDLPDKAISPADAAVLHGQLALVVVALDLLLENDLFAPKTVQMFKALIFEQRSPNDVAQAFATSRGNVDQAKSSILKKLRPMYDALDRGLDPATALQNAG
jgi:RNA polymerase sigma factor (sigma-70 family)